MSASRELGLHVRRSRVLRLVATDLSTKRDVRRVRTSSVQVPVKELSAVLAAVSGAACMPGMNQNIGANDAGVSSRTLQVAVYMGRSMRVRT